MKGTLSLDEQRSSKQLTGTRKKKTGNLRLKIPIRGVVNEKSLSDKLF